MKVIHIAVDIADKKLAMSIQSMLKEVPDAEIGALITTEAKNAEPEIILIEDDASDAFLTKLRQLRLNFTKTAIFVISPNMDPAHIIDVMKAGGSEYLMAPPAKDKLLKAIQDTRAKYESESQQGLIYSFISSKGGLGSTFLAVNAAEAMALETKEKVALWDVSFQSGDATVFLDLIPRCTIYDICQNIEHLDHALLKSAMCKHPDGIELLSAPKLPEESDDISPGHIKKILQVIKAQYGNIFIDCPSMLITESAIEIFNASTKIFVTIDMSVPSIRNAGRFFELIQKIHIDSQKIEFVINRYVPNGILTTVKVEHSLGKRIFWHFPNDFGGVTSSINKGDPLVRSAPRSELVQNIFTFIQKLNNPVQYKDIRGTEKKRRFRRSLNLLKD